MNNQQPFNNQVEHLRFSPLLKNQQHSPTSHYLLVRADVGRKSGKGDSLEVPLLVDTGATYTILPEITLKNLGYDTENPIARYDKLVTGGGDRLGIAIVQVSSFYCLGKQMIDFPVLAYSLPKSPNQRYWRGVLGMDFLTHFRAVILLENSQTGQADQIVLR
jgi:hypothetical protein